MRTLITHTLMLTVAAPFLALFGAVHSPSGFLELFVVLLGLPVVYVAGVSWAHSEVSA